MKRKGIIAFDEQIDRSLKLMMAEMKKMGIRNPSKPLALKRIIEMNQAARIKLKRKSRSKNGLVYS
jgi:hypothetical protein